MISGRMFGALATAALVTSASGAQQPAKGTRAKTTIPAALVGTWTLVAADVRHPDGTVGRDYGAAPSGRMMIDRQGRYATQIMKSERPKFASGDKAKGTEAEYREASLGLSTHFGQLSATKDAVTFAIENSAFPNWIGTKQVRAYRLEGDVFTYTVPARPNGDVPISVWRRLPDR